MIKKLFNSSCIALIVLLLALYTTAFGYEIGTHETMSEVATGLSDNLKSYDLSILGLSSSTDGITAEGVKCRDNTPSTKSALEWIKEGSVCEDDTFTQVFARYKNHFYDPISKKGFGGILWPDSGILSGKPAPDWAIDFGPSDGQLYSFSQGRQYFLDAISKPTEAERKTNLARMFRTLGDVVHLVQDMAQPQHTRNDGHGFPKSVYEVHTDVLQKRKSLIYTGSPIPKFTTAREYYTDLAQFSNSNFVTAGTNFKILGGQAASGTRYSSPAPGSATVVPIQALNPPVSPTIQSWCIANANTDCSMSFYSTNQTVFNERASALSIFDQYVHLRPVTYTDPDSLITYQTDRIFTLNQYTFNSAHPFLIPKAVSYSAGLIDYFFRGKIDMVPDVANAGKYSLKNLGTETISGNFTLYYDAVDGMRYPVAGDTLPAGDPVQTWVNREILANSQLDALTFTPPTNPAPKTPGEYMLVFKGTMGEEKAENGAVGAVIAKLIQQGLVTDYVAMSMPNPVPYRGVSIGVVDKGAPSYTASLVSSYDLGYRLDTVKWSLRNSSGATVGTVTGTLSYEGYPGSTPMSNYLFDSTNILGSINGAKWQTFTGVYNGYTQMYVGTWALTNPSYEALLAADIASDTGGARTYVMASDGEVLASEVQNTPQQNHIQFMAIDTIWDYTSEDFTWSGGNKTRMYDNDSRVSNYYVYDHDLIWSTPEDCIYPFPKIIPPMLPLHGDGSGIGGTVSTTPVEQAEWNIYWADGVTAFKTRSWSWLNKNSDEFIAALKTGFVPGALGVSRAELQTGALPSAWELQIKRDVDSEYGKYPRDPYNVMVGKHTRRSVQFVESAYSETVQSDTSADLSQAGAKVTKREVTLKYDIPVLQSDGSTVIETRTVSVTGYLTQTVTQHNDKQGNWIDLSQKDEYVNWYNRENMPLPAGVPNSITSPYLQDANPSRIGIVLNGTAQQGYNADSTLGTIGNPLNYATYVPAYPKASSAVAASAIPDFITTWHKDAKIEYLENGVGASYLQNDSALFGVTQVEITPLGLIADGKGSAPAGTSLGIFSSGETGTQAEIYGTAVYNFDWKTGALSFSKWKPLLDTNGGEVALKIIDLPAGGKRDYSKVNSIITYKGLHWPDVVAAIKARDEDMSSGTFAYTDPVLNELIKNVKGVGVK